jgi:hyperosmotically inducible periplasmic protein
MKRTMLAPAIALALAACSTPQPVRSAPAACGSAPLDMLTSGSAHDAGAPAAPGGAVWGSPGDPWGLGPWPGPTLAPPSANPPLSPGNTGADLAGEPDDSQPAPPDVSEADRMMTWRIRRALSSNRTLSVAARAVTVSTVHGSVTLTGEVDTEADRAAIVAAARRAVGAELVESRITVRK